LALPWGGSTIAGEEDCIAIFNEDPRAAAAAAVRSEQRKRNTAKVAVKSAESVRALVKPVPRHHHHHHHHHGKDWRFG
jgi:hypothetical protein